MLPPTNLKFKRNWKNYCPVKLNERLKCKLDNVNFNWNDLSVQGHWNELEHLLIGITDELAPLICYKVNDNPRRNMLPSSVKKQDQHEKKTHKIG